MANSVVFKVALVVVACMLVTAPYAAQGAITCGTVVTNLRPCLNYLMKGGAVPNTCCGGVRALNAAAKSTPERQTACGCLKTAAAQAQGIKPAFASALPGKCGVSI
ncbi:Non-specific lipid-transfer protein, partial [Thalictrum thalictroides]